ncbi:hypothetical protein KCP69_06120 [Salmonella enterica subsp. enterica]|nr:hypothetical protein KCP69_06120 [Salmonella enterica subsp. enterica]
MLWYPERNAGFTFSDGGAHNTLMIEGGETCNCMVNAGATVLMWGESTRRGMAGSERWKEAGSRYSGTGSNRATF